MKSITLTLVAFLSLTALAEDSKNQSQQQQQVQQQSQSSGLSFNDALRQGPVNFRGKRIEEKKERPKVEVDTSALKKVLEEAMGKKE